MTPEERAQLEAGLAEALPWARAELPERFEAWRRAREGADGALYGRLCAELRAAFAARARFFLCEGLRLGEPVVLTEACGDRSTMLVDGLEAPAALFDLAELEQIADAGPERGLEVARALARTKRILGGRLLKVAAHWKKNNAAEKEEGKGNGTSV
jgi:hypothetical protein